MNLHQVDLNLLVAFERVLVLGSVTRAAKELGVTQPAMSRTLQRLRDSLGDPLFVKVGRTLVPTDRARALQEPLGEALRAVGRVLEPPPAFVPATATGTFTIALGEEAQVAFIDTIVEAIWAAAPQIDVRVRPLSLQTLEDGRRGIVDVAICRSSLRFRVRRSTSARWCRRSSTRGASSSCGRNGTRNGSRSRSTPPRRT